MPDAPPPADDPRPEQGCVHASGVGRRALLKAAAAGGATATIAAFWFEGFGDPRRRARVEPTPADGPALTFDAQQWRMVEAALDRLLPSEPDAPGARDVNAVGYLDRVLHEPELEPARYLDVIVSGLSVVHERAVRRGAAGFADLPGEAQDAVLRSLESEEGGVLWLKRMLYFALEALLGDPVHGCQPGEVGWKWLGNAPAAPRPTSRERRPRR